VKKCLSPLFNIELLIAWLMDLSTIIWKTVYVHGISVGYCVWKGCSTESYTSLDWTI